VAWPEFVTVDDSILLLPTVTLPNARLLGFSVSLPTGLAVPVPVSEIVVGDCGSLLLIEMSPESAPVLVGEKDTLTVADCPALMVFGVVIPETPNGAPFTLIIEMFRSEPPVFVRVKLAESLVPIVTEPKPTLAGFTLSCACAGVAFAASATGPEKAPASVFKDKVALTGPVEVPLKETIRFAVEPEGREKGNVSPENVNCLPLKSASAIFRVVVPVFLIDTVCDTFLPTTTLPKFKFDGVNWMDAWAGFTPFNFPAHPLNSASGMIAATNNIARCCHARLFRERVLFSPCFPDSFPALILILPRVSSLWRVRWEAARRILVGGPIKGQALCLSPGTSGCTVLFL
jgi:hypothetical protein